MSTYWYFQCTDHTPVVQSAGEFTQHTEDTHWKTALNRVKVRPVGNVAPRSTGTGWFYDNTTAFLQDHPTCHINIISEYGEVREIDNGPNVIPTQPKPLTDTRGPQMGDAWDEGFESAVTWMENNPTPSGVQVDPPENPYMNPIRDEAITVVPTDMYEKLLNAARGYTAFPHADVVKAIGYLPTEELRGKHH